MSTCNLSWIIELYKGLKYLYDSGLRLRANAKGLFGCKNRILLKSERGTGWRVTERLVEPRAGGTGVQRKGTRRGAADLLFSHLEARCWPLSLPFCSCFIHFSLWRLVFLVYQGCATVTVCGLFIQTPWINSRVPLSSDDILARTENRSLWARGPPAVGAAAVRVVCPHGYCVLCQGSGKASMEGIEVRAGIRGNIF